MRHGFSAIVAAVLAGAWTGPARAEEPVAMPPALPDALPPLDDTLEGTAPDPVRFFASARLRAELEGARGFSRGDAAGVGASVGGLAGVEALLGDAESGARLVVSFAEAGRLGPPTDRPLLVSAAPLAPLHQAQLALQTRLFGLPAELSVGRGAVALADERLLGTEPLELRPRTLDGASARVRADTVELGAGAWWLGGDGDDLDAVGALDTALHLGDDASLQAWALAERAGLSALWLPTLGARALGRVGWVEGRAAAELQAPHAVATLEREGVAGRASAGGRITLDGSELALPLPRVFADLDGELVAGDAVAGRVLHAPAPTRHGVRGALDLLAPDNTWCTGLTLGLAEERLSASIRGLLVGMVDRAGPLLDPLGDPILARRSGGAGLALLELDVGLSAQLSPDVALSISWAAAAPGPALVGEVPAQQLFVELRASTQGP